MVVDEERERKKECEAKAEWVVGGGAPTSMNKMRCGDALFPISFMGIFPVRSNTSQ